MVGGRVGYIGLLTYSSSSGDDQTDDMFHRQIMLQ